VIHRTLNVTYKVAKRIVIGVVGTTVVLIGLVMLVTPGPALVVIPVGLAILSLEFTWARMWLRKLRQALSNNSLNGRAARAEHHRRRVDPAASPPGEKDRAR
jgi:tellurite resistance protein TerC